MFCVRVLISNQFIFGEVATNSYHQFCQDFVHFVEVGGVPINVFAKQQKSMRLHL